MKSKFELFTTKVSLLINYLHYKGNKFSLFFNCAILLGICLNLKEKKTSHLII